MNTGGAAATVEEIDAVLLRVEELERVVERMSLMLAKVAIACRVVNTLSVDIAANIDDLRK